MSWGRNQLHANYHNKKSQDFLKKKTEELSRKENKTMKNDMRKLLNEILPHVCFETQKWVLEPAGNTFGGWKVGEDIHPEKKLYRSFVDWHGNPSHRYQYRRPNNQGNGNIAIDFHNLRLTEIESVTLGNVETSQPNGKHTKVIELINRTDEPLTFSREVEASSETEKTSTKETEIEVEASQELTVSASYMSVSAEAKVAFRQQFRQRKEEQKRQLQAMRESISVDYVVPAGRKMIIKRTTGVGTVKQKVTTVGKVDFNMNIWAKSRGDYRFNSYDDFLAQVSGTSLVKSPFTDYFNMDERGLPDNVLNYFPRPTITLESILVDDSGVFDERDISLVTL